MNSIYKIRLGQAKLTVLSGKALWPCLLTSSLSIRFLHDDRVGDAPQASHGIPLEERPFFTQFLAKASPLIKRLFRKGRCIHAERCTARFWAFSLPKPLKVRDGSSINPKASIE